MGLVIVTGPTGSGKSTTLAAMIDYINRYRRCHIVTIEDPIEYVHANHRSAVSQREVGTDTESFSRALRSVLREDPDVLLVGEMRDQESIATTLTIAETGHLVFATLHTNDSAQAIDRIVDIFPSDRREQIQVQLASTLEGVIYQRLVPRIGGGLVAAYEVLMANHAVRNLVREGKTRQLRNVVSTHQSEGMQTLEMGLNALMARGPDRLRDGPAGQPVPEGGRQASRRIGASAARPASGPASRLRRSDPAAGVFGLTRIPTSYEASPRSARRITVVSEYRVVPCRCTVPIGEPSCPIDRWPGWCPARGDGWWPGRSSRASPCPPKRPRSSPPCWTSLTTSPPTRSSPSLLR